MGRRFDPDRAHMKIRFRDFPHDHSRLVLRRLIEMVYQCDFEETNAVNERVDVEITGPYSGDSDSFKTPTLTRALRGAVSRFSPGAHLTIPRLVTGVTPNPKAKVNIWYTGENQRPPYGNWNAYLSFDSKFPSHKNFYLPLWLLTSSDFIIPLESSYWGRKNPTLEELITPREISKRKKKFACAFFGKTYRMRLHAINALKELGAVDVFGQGSRRLVKNPSLIAREYKFAICFENDLYPGYVTEKPVEAYLAGTIPIYYGIDSESYLNPKAMFNLFDYRSEHEWISRIKEVSADHELYTEMYKEPLLLKRPSLQKLVVSLREAILCEE